MRAPKRAMANQQVNVRLPPEIMCKIQALIDSGDFGNAVEFVRYAVRKTLKDYDARSPPAS